MPELIINEVPIDFPHPNPYNVQRTYMEKVIECLKDNKNGVLESPTGTGKTLSLLCASLAWLKQKKDEAEMLQTSRNNAENGEQHEHTVLDESTNESVSVAIKIPKIIYASRTHTQLTQAIKELKQTNYKYMKVGVFASRDQLCINPDLTFENNATKSEMCASKTKKRLDPVNNTQRCECLFFEQFETLNKDNEFRTTNLENKILDVEDLRSSGRELGYCPFYMSKMLIEDADIVFMPYNYLLDPKIRNSVGRDLNDAVVILDEAHNVPQVCEDSASIEFKSSHITDAIREVDSIANFINESRNEPKLTPFTIFNPSELNDLKNILLRFKTAIDNIQLSRVSSTLMAAEFDGDFIFTLMETADIAYHTSRNITNLIRNILQYVSDCIALLRSPESKSLQVNLSQIRLSNQSPGLRKFNEILWTTFAHCGDDFRDDINKHYRVYATYDKSQMIQSDAPVKIINYWCFSPKFALEYLLYHQHVRSIIFTSGTISPMQPFITSLGISIDVVLQNSHIIDQSQVLVEIISHGPDSEELLSNYDNRSTAKYLYSLGSTIVKLSQVVPDGLLIFFPSYKILNMCKKNWQDKGIWSAIERIKPIFVEPQIKEEFIKTMKNYYRQINNATMKGAIFMAVCRGKVSEGLDFADTNGRAVIITGLPFPPMFDAKIRMKRNYMQRNFTTRNESLSGDEWYQLEASRAVNQAIGRVIRHRNDYGAILLCDIRFNKATQKSQLSQWIQRHIRCDNSRRSFDSIINSISQFFRTQLVAALNVTNSSTVTPSTHQITLEIIEEMTERPSIIPQDCNTSIGEMNLSGDDGTIAESPVTPFARCVDSLPLSSLSVTSPILKTSPSSSNNVNSTGGTPSKRKCATYLSQRFNEDN